MEVEQSMINISDQRSLVVQSTTLSCLPNYSEGGFVSCLGSSRRQFFCVLLVCLGTMTEFLMNT